MSELNIVCVLDRSGSMSSVMEEMVQSFNAFIKEQIKKEEDAKLTMISFNWKNETIFDKVPLKDVPELTVDMVSPIGGTALFDALGKAITLVNSDNTIVLVQTDGEENCSSIFSNKAIKEMITLKEQQGWEFVFIGSGLDEMTAERARSSMTDYFSLSTDRTVAFSRTSGISSVGAFGPKGPRGPQGDLGLYGTVLNAAVSNYLKK